MDNQTPIERVFNRMAAAILEHNDGCPDKDHRNMMRRVILDQVELAKRRIEDVCPNEQSS